MYIHENNKAVIVHMTSQLHTMQCILSICNVYGTCIHCTVMGSICLLQ